MMNMKRILSLLLLACMLTATLSACAPVTSPTLSDYPEVGVEYEEMAATGSTPTLRVMSFNIQNTLAADATRRENRIQAVVNEILLYKPDLIGFQEDYGIYWDSSREIMDRLNEAGCNYGYYGESADSTTTFEHDAILVNLSALTVKNSGWRYLNDKNASSDIASAKADLPTDISFADINGNTLEYSTDGVNFTKVTRDNFYSSTARLISGATYWRFTNTSGVTETVQNQWLGARRMSWVELTDKAGNTFLYVNTHLQHRSQTSSFAKSVPAYLQIREIERLCEWEYVMDLINTSYASTPVVVTGDFNDVPNQSSGIYAQCVSDGFTDAARNAEISKGQTGTWNPAFDKSEATNGKLLSYAETTKAGTYSSRLDYIWMSTGDFYIKSYDVGHGCVKGTYAGGEGYVVTSDHLPVIVDFSVGAPDAPIELERPGYEKEGSTISYFSGTASTKWYTDNPDADTFYLNSADDFMGFISLRGNSDAAKHAFEGKTVVLKVNVVLNRTTTDNPLSKADFLPAVDGGSVKSYAQLAGNQKAFKGTFNGGGHYISGVYLAITSSANRSLFGALGDGATIQHLSIVNSLVDCTGTTKNNGSIGIIAGSLWSSATTTNDAATVVTVTMSNIYNAANIVSGGTYTMHTLGGFLGRAEQACDLTLEHCIYNGNIVGTLNNNGGLIGSINYSAAKVTIHDCVTGGSVTGTEYVGGLIGKVNKAKYLAISNCYSTTAVNAQSISGGLIGGFSNYCREFYLADSVVNANLDFSSATGSFAKGQQVGGAIGRMYAVGTEDNHAQISNVMIYGSMKAAASVITSELSKTKTSGGFIGFVDGGTSTPSYVHVDSILLNQDLYDVETILGASRNINISGATSRFSFDRIYYGNHIRYTTEVDMALAGYNVNTGKRISENTEAYDQYGDRTGKYLHEIVGSKILQTWRYRKDQCPVPTVTLENLINKYKALQNTAVVAYQTASSENGANYSDFRFVATIKDCKSQALGFEVKFTYVTTSKNGSVYRSESLTEIGYCGYVYTSVKGGSKTYTAEQYGGEYLFTVVVKNVPLTGYDSIVLEITPFEAFVNEDGSVDKVYGYSTYYEVK